METIPMVTSERAGSSERTTRRLTEAAAAEPVDSITRDYLDHFRALLDQVDAAKVEHVVSRLREARDSGATVFIAGNGGSAASATHLANDLGKATKRSDCRPFRALCLSDNVSWLTALANDDGYERVFSGQLENFMEPGDVLIVISASGNSPNLINAVELAEAHGMTTIGLLGFDGGKLKDLVDEYLWVESEQGAYGLVESAHTVLCDIITTCLMLDRHVMIEAMP